MDDDSEARLRVIEQDVVAIKTTMPTLATREQLAELAGKITTLQATAATMATSAEVATITATLPALLTKDEFNTRLARTLATGLGVLAVYVTIVVAIAGLLLRKAGGP